MKINFKVIALKVVVFAYERWSLTRDALHNGLTWKPGHWGLNMITCNNYFKLITHHSKDHSTPSVPRDSVDESYTNAAG